LRLSHHSANSSENSTSHATVLICHGRHYAVKGIFTSIRSPEWQGGGCRCPPVRTERERMGQPRVHFADGKRWPAPSDIGKSPPCPSEKRGTRTGHPIGKGRERVGQPRANKTCNGSSARAIAGIRHENCFLNGITESVPCGA
jgi:hypothetical protein